MKTDADFLSRDERYAAHMARFVAAHAAMPDPQRKVLIELERRERWAQIMGDYALVLDPPEIT